MVCETVIIGVGRVILHEDDSIGESTAFSCYIQRVICEAVDRERGACNASHTLGLEVINSLLNFRWLLEEEDWHETS